MNGRQVKSLAVNGLLIALAFGFAFVERLVAVPVPVAGFKLGLANIVTLFALYHLNARSAYLILIGRCLLSAALFGGATQLAFALTGGTFALVTMLLLKKLNCFSPFGVSMGGAAAHNTGQVLAAMVIMRNANLISYLLILLPVAVPTGLLIGLLYRPVSRVGAYMEKELGHQKGQNK